jgi:hypothetical protein
MAIIYYGNRVRETSTTSGAGNLVLSGAPVGYKNFTSTIGANNKVTYYIYRQDTNFEWEVGVGYVVSSGGVDQLVRERVVSSSNSNNLVGFTNGTKYVETIIAENSFNSGFVNLEEKSSSFSASYATATYIIDSSGGNVTISLPQVSIKEDPVILTFILNSTTGSVYEQTNAIILTPYGTETINGVNSSESISILNDCLQLVSVPSVDGWVKLDPIQDSTNPYGNDGYVQFKYDGSFSGVAELYWNNSSKSLYIGNSGTPDINLPSSSGQTTVFNQRLYDNDFRVAGTGNSHLLFVDGGSNSIGVNTSAPQDMLTVNAGSKNGLSVYKSGSGPVITIGNTSTSGLATNNIIGTIVYSGLNSTNSSVNYAKIITEVESPTSGSEKSFIRLGIMNNGSFEDVAVFSPSGVNLGFDNSNLNGTIIGSASSNEGNNVVLGYYNNVCGENCSVIGDNIVISSGTFGGAIGSNHASSGNNIWIFGGENVNVSGDNRVYVAVNNNNHFSIIGTGYASYTTSTDGDTLFAIKNKSVLSSGVDQSIGFIFNNSVGVEKTGLLLVSQIDNVSSGTESNTFKLQLLNNGSLTDAIIVGSNNINIGDNSVSGVNNVIGTDNTVSSTGNNIIGKLITASGVDNNLIGNNIVCSGNNNTIFGKDNTCLSSGNLGIVMVGNGNQVDEDYAVAIGIDNANSGLYSFSCGYMNGAHGDYVVSMGHANLVTANYSVAVGKNNTLEATDLNASLFFIGAGNSGSISNTGIIVGYLNDMQGSGSLIVGNNCSISGSNNTIIGNDITYNGNDTVLISGTTSNLYGTTINVSGTTLNLSGSAITASGSSVTIQSNNNQKFTTSSTLTSIYGSSGIYVSGNAIDINGSQTILNTTQILVSGLTGFKQPNPSYTVDVSGSFRVSNTGVGVIYENCPASTGVSPSGLVIENNIIKASTPVNIEGVNIANFTSSSMTLGASDKKTQLLNPVSNGTYTLNLGITNVPTGKEFFIRNTTTARYSQTIDIVDSYSSTSLVAGGIGGILLTAHVVFDGTQWRLISSTTE